MFSEETDGLIASFDCLHHVPRGCIFTDEVSLPQLSDLVVGLTFSVNYCLKVVVGQRILVLVTGRLLLVLFVIILLFVVLRHAFRDRVTVHVKIKVFHVHLTRDLAVPRFYWSHSLLLNCVVRHLAGELVRGHR